MRRFQVGIAAVVAALSGSMAQAAPSALELLPAVQDVFSGRGCDLPKLKRLISASDFGALDVKLRSVSYGAVAVCDAKDGLKWAKLATAEPGTPGAAWAIRVAVDVDHHDIDDALTSVEALIASPKGEGIELLEDRMVSLLARQSRDDPRASVRFLTILDRADWRPAQPFDTGDGLWQDLAGHLLEAGDLAGARRVASKITDVQTLIEMRLDKRFDPLVAADPARFDLATAAREVLETHRRLLAVSPRNGVGVNQVASDLTLINRHAEALALVEAALQDPSPLPNERGEDQRNWILNARATALKGVGRMDEAIEALRQGANKKEGGVTNVSQTINLAGFMNAAGRHQEAIAVLTPFEFGLTASPYGNMWVAAERTCAYYGLQQPQDAAKTLEFTKDHANDNAPARAKALLCASDLDGLAADYIGRLKDPRKRKAALIELSRFPDRDHPTPVEVEEKHRMDSLRDRPDLLAAIAEAGRITDLPFYPGALIDLY